MSKKKTEKTKVKFKSICEHEIDCAEVSIKFKVYRQSGETFQEFMENLFEISNNHLWNDVEREITLTNE